MSNYVVSDGNLIDIADAIRAKGQTVAPLEFPDGFTNAIKSIPTGGGGADVADNDVMFLDPLASDGKGNIVASFSASEFLSLSEMPANPDHSTFVFHGVSIPMTSLGWNWSLTDAKAFVAKYGGLLIGQLYKPSDNCTHFVVEIVDDPQMGLQLPVPVSNKAGISVSIDNGEPFELTSYKLSGLDLGIHDIKLISTQNYAIYSSGAYNAKDKHVCAAYLGIFASVSACYGNLYLYSFGRIEIFTLPALIGDLSIGETSIRSFVVPNGSYALSGFSSNFSLVYCSFGNGMTGFISTYISSMRYFYIPDTCTSVPNINAPQSVKAGNCPFSIIKDNLFDSNYTLERVALDIGAGYCLRNSYALKTLIINPNGNSVGASALEYTGLTEVHIPSSITEIKMRAFYSSALRRIKLDSSTPPTLGNANAFTGLDNAYQIIVPAGAKAAYDAETNWSTLASHIVEEAE